MRKTNIIFSILALGIILLIPRHAFAQLYWNVEVVDSVADTLTVELAPTSMPYCGDKNCFEHCEYSLWVTPCPLYENCTDSTYVRDNLIGPNPSRIELKFLVGISYSLGGNYHYFGYSGTTHDGQPCANLCILRKEMEIRTYPDDYVATANSTWGRIKKLWDYKE